MPYVLQYIFILIAPTLFAACIYMVLTRLIRRLQAEKLCFIPTKWLTKIFLLGDIVSFLVQFVGGLMATSTDAKMDPVLAKNIILLGLFIQVVIFGLYIITIVIFHLRMRKATGIGAANAMNFPWQPIIYLLYGVGLLIMVRSIYRIIEFVIGMDSFLFTHEWPLYALDGGPMLAVVIVWALRYPSELNPNRIAEDTSSYLSLNDPREGLVPLSQLKEQTSSLIEHRKPEYTSPSGGNQQLPRTSPPYSSDEQHHR